MQIHAEIREIADKAICSTFDKRLENPVHVFHLNCVVTNCFGILNISAF